MNTKELDFEIVDLGAHSPDYFQGFGVSYTKFSDCCNGIGDTAEEAYQDALDSMAQQDNHSCELMPEVCGIDNGVDHTDHIGLSCTDDMSDYPCDIYYHVGIRWNPINVE